jgi:3'(2'), 5'-bisphosphate nucleotidase
MVAADLLPAVIALTREAGRAVMAHYGTDGAVQEKDDRSPLTLADQAAHQILVDGLGCLDPAAPVISEEGRLAPAEERRSWRRFWLVDPLDGTKEFLKRRDEFTVNVALIENGEPVLGVVQAPALDLIYWARSGSGEPRPPNASSPDRRRPAPRSPSWRACRIHRRSWRPICRRFRWRAA